MMSDLTHTGSALQASELSWSAHRHRLPLRHDDSDMPADTISESDERNRRNELRDRLDACLYETSANDGGTLRRRSLLQGQSGDVDQNPGYPKAIWSQAKKHGARTQIAPGHLVAEVYIELLRMIDQGSLRTVAPRPAEGPDVPMIRVVQKRISWRATDAYERHTAPDEENIAEAQRLEALEDPRYNHEIERLRKSRKSREIGDHHGKDDEGQSLWDVVTWDHMTQERFAHPENFFEAEGAAVRMNDYMMCLEACSDGNPNLSAALTWSTILFYDIDLADVPQQATGAGADNPAKWPALWFSCLDPNLFRNEDRFRSKRSRRFKQIAALRSRALHLYRVSGQQ